MTVENFKHLAGQVVGHLPCCSPICSAQNVEVKISSGGWAYSSCDGRADRITCGYHSRWTIEQTRQLAEFMRTGKSGNGQQEKPAEQPIPADPAEPENPVEQPEPVERDPAPKPKPEPEPEPVGTYFD